jgi:tetratricopeptide (TPR) repeat protein
MSWDPYDDRPASPPARFPIWLLALGALAAAALSLLGWYLVSPLSFARAYGKALGPPLAVNSLDLAVGGEVKRIPQGETLAVNPKRTLAIKGLNTNRWKNYDLLFYSPDFDVLAIAREGASLVKLFGQDAFMEPKTVAVEVMDGEEVVARFGIKGEYEAADFGELALAAVEPAGKIEYYRKALGLEPQSRAYAEGLREALFSAGRKEELIGLLEGDLAKAGEDGQEAILARLLALHREAKDEPKEIAALERLLALAEKNGDAAKAVGLKSALAAAYEGKDPKKAAGLYESLAEAAGGDSRAARSRLTQLIGLYKTLGDEAKEESVYQRLLPLAAGEERLGLWGEIARLREARGDRPGQAEAWAALAELLPPGEPKANAYKRLGFLKYEGEDYPASERAYLAAVEHGDDDAAVYLNLARLALAKDDPAAHREYLAKALALGELPEIRLELAQALTRAGLSAEAAASWEKLASLPGQGAEEARVRGLAQAQLVGLHRPPEGETSEEFERVLYRHSQESVEFYNLGVAHFQKKDWDKAKRAFLRAVELKGEGQLEADAREYLLAIYKETGQTKEMLEQANWIYPANRDKKEVRDLLAHQYEADKDWAGLVKAATEWAGQDDEAKNWGYLALGQGKLGQRKEAAQSLLKAAQRDSKASAWLAAAQAMEKAGDKPQARKAYERALDLDPGNAAAEAALVRMAMESLSNRRSNGR